MADSEGTMVHQDLATSAMKPSSLAYPSFIPPPNGHQIENTAIVYAA
jgi:hypothetical protein